jgi:hypothetical protein
VALIDYLVNIIGDGDVVNAYAYAHAPAQGTPIYIIVDNVSWYQERLDKTLPVGSCVQICKAIQGHPSAGTWCSWHFDDVQIVPCFTEPTLYRRT